MLDTEQLEQLMKLLDGFSTPSGPLPRSARVRIYVYLDHPNQQTWLSASEVVLNALRFQTLERACTEHGYSAFRLPDGSWSELPGTEQVLKALGG
jgi:hypothetical protein